MDMTQREIKKLMRRIHDARDRNTTALLKPHQIGLENEEHLKKLNALDLVSLHFADNKVYCFALTKPGLVFFERRTEERWRFIRRSVLMPIGVSIVTTSIIWCLKFLITGSWI